MIIVNLFGGLGNQLFQIAAAINLSRIKNKEIIIDESLLNYFRFSHKRVDLSEIFEIHFKKKRQNNYLNIGIKKLILKFKYIIKFQSYYVNEINYSEFLESKSDKLEMIGYWQNLDYLTPYKNEILNTIRFKNFDIDEKLLKKIEQTNSVSLHIRRGDFLSKNNTVSYGLPIEYYLKALNKLVKLEKKFNLFIFSDDKEWVKKEFVKYLSDFDYQIVSTDQSYKDFFLMVQCKHHIISNSTFSWWGAFLNDNKNKLVFYPEIWFKKNKSPPKIFENHWIKL